MEGGSVKVRFWSESLSAGKMASAIAMVSGLTLLVQCKPADTREIPEKILVQAKAQDGYHVHISVLFYATSNRPFCHGVFGESPINEEKSYQDISKAGVEIEIRKRWPGYCGFRFGMMSVACTRESTLPRIYDNTYEPVSIGIHDSLEPDPKVRAKIAHSPNRILDNSMNIRVSGATAHFWGCDSNCEDSDDFGMDGRNTHLSIDCREE